MKREILCLPCAMAFLPILVSAKREPYDPPEWHKWAYGKLSKSCLCDHCNRPMEHGEDARALSISRHDNIYDWWSGEYFIPAPEAGGEEKRS